MSKRAWTICCAHLKSAATCGLPDAVWMTPTLIVPLLMPGPVHVAAEPPAVVAEPAAVVADAAAVVAGGVAFLLLLHAPTPMAATAAKTTRDLARRNMFSNPPLDWGASSRNRRLDGSAVLEPILA